MLGAAVTCGHHSVNTNTSLIFSVKANLAANYRVRRQWLSRCNISAVASVRGECRSDKQWTPAHLDRKKKIFTRRIINPDMTKPFQTQRCNQSRNLMRCFTYNTAQSQSQTVKYITQGVIMHQYDNRPQTLEWLRGRAVCIRMRWMHKEVHLQKQVSPQEMRRSRLSGGSYTIHLWDWGDMSCVHPAISRDAGSHSELGGAGPMMPA